MPTRPTDRWCWEITLYNLDNLNPKTVNAKTAYFKTIHHEFGHILNQTKPYPTDFAEISGPDYVQDQCFEIYKTTESALQKGFISPYASKADGEDFVELIALYVNRSAEEWEEMLTTAGDTGRPKIEAKFEIVSNYMKSTWKSYCAVRKKRPTSTSTRWMTKIRTRPKIPVQTNKRHRI